MLDCILGHPWNNSRISLYNQKKKSPLILLNWFLYFPDFYIGFFCAIILQFMNRTVGSVISLLLIWNKRKMFHNWLQTTGKEKRILHNLIMIQLFLISLNLIYCLLEKLEINICMWFGCRFKLYCVHERKNDAMLSW